MKTRYFLLLSVLAISCNEYEYSAPSPQPTPIDLITPIVDATADSLPFNGVLEVLTCVYNTSTYFGNYTTTGSILPVPGYYIYEGDTLNQVSPIRLPLGNYTILYWGYPSFFTDSIGTATTPPLSVGSNLANLSISLRARANSTYYYPSQELVFATQNANIGTDSLTAYLNRVTALLNVSVGNANSTALTSIDSMWVTVGNIANSLNLYTAAAANQTRTVSVGLTPNSTNTTWTCSNISVFPSAATPPMTLYIVLNNGTQYSYSQNLSVTLAASTLTNVTILLNGIISTENQPGGFTIESWTVQSDTLNVPSISKVRNLNRLF